MHDTCITGDDIVMFHESDKGVAIARNIRENTDGSVLCDILASEDEGYTVVIDERMEKDEYASFKSQSSVISMQEAQERIAARHTTGA